MRPMRSPGTLRPEFPIAQGSRIPALLLAAALLGVVVSALHAGDGEKEKSITLRSNEKITGAEVKKAVDKVLAGVHWHTDLSHALALAAEEKKPVFWLQLVGGLDDGL
jgi:hypothetical protein